MELDEDNDGKKVIHIQGIGGWIIVFFAAWGAIDFCIRVYQFSH